MINVDLKALLSKLSRYCTGALEGAAGLCISRGNYEIAVEHMLLKLVEDPDGDFQYILRHYGIDPARVEKAIQHAVEQAKTGNAGKPVFSPLFLEWVESAWLLASLEQGLQQIRSGALVAALLTNPSRYGASLDLDLLGDISADELRRDLADITAGSREDTGPATTAAPGGEAQPRGDTALAKFTINFTARARAGEIDPVFCRDREIRQMIDILGRRRKNNPIAVGEAGVGKTAVVEGLAVKIVEGDVPELLQDVDLLGLDMGLLQAGASVKGEFENRLKGVIEEVKASPKPIILFIDEAHTLIGAGGQAGGSDAANLLKPALARGELRTIAATTWSEYKKYFEKDPALARRFQLVKLEEPSPEDAVQIIRGLRDAYERAHGVYVRDDAVEAAAQLSARYISGRQLPDKAVDVLDTACTRVKLSLSSKPDVIDDGERRIRELERTLGAIRRDIEASIRPEDEAVQELSDQIEAIRADLETHTQRWENERGLVVKLQDLRRRLAHKRQGAQEGKPESDQAAAEEASAEALQAELDTVMKELAEAQGHDPLIHYEVTPHVVSRVIADWTGIPLGKMVSDDAQKILGFADELGKRIKGQDHVVRAVGEGVKAAKAGLVGNNAPMGVFLFVGPSGVGKTETATGVAELLFGGERFMVTINMSEFQEKHTLSRLVGSPPGYVGYGEGGVLTEAVRQRPYSVVLLDEVEKADLDVMNLFYQVFDKGTLSDGEGRIIDFKNTVLFLTSNLASDIITEMCVGDGERPDPDTLVEAIRPVLSAHFRPALLARMRIIPFFPISSDAMGDIVKIKLDRLGNRMRESHRMTFSYSPEVVDQIAKRCTEVETGARNIDHIISGTLLPRLSTHIVERMGAQAPLNALELGIGADGDFTVNFT